MSTGRPQVSLINLVGRPPCGIVRLGRRGMGRNENQGGHSFGLACGRKRSRAPQRRHALRGIRDAHRSSRAPSMAHQNRGLRPSIAPAPAPSTPPSVLVDRPPNLAIHGNAADGTMEIGTGRSTSIASTRDRVHEQRRGASLRPIDRRDSLSGRDCSIINQVADRTVRMTCRPARVGAGSPLDH